MAVIKVGVKIQLKKEVLDTRGRTLLQLIQKHKPLVQFCRYGKYLELGLNEKDKKKALKQADEIAKTILCNDLIETFDLELLNEVNSN